MRLQWKTLVAMGFAGAVIGAGYALLTGNDSLLINCIIFAVCGIALPIAADALDTRVFGATPEGAPATP